MTHANSLLQSNTRLVTSGYSTGDSPRVKVDKLLRDAPLVKPEILKIHRSSDKLRVFSLPLVNMQRNEFHFSFREIINLIIQTRDYLKLFPELSM